MLPCTQPCFALRAACFLADLHSVGETWRIRQRVQNMSALHKRSSCAAFFIHRTDNRRYSWPRFLTDGGAAVLNNGKTKRCFINLPKCQSICTPSNLSSIFTLTLDTFNSCAITFTLGGVFVVTDIQSQGTMSFRYFFFQFFKCLHLPGRIAF